MESSPSRQPSLKRAAPSPPPGQPLTPPLTPAYTLAKKDAKRSPRMDRGSRFLSPPSPARHVLYSTFASRSEDSSLSSMASQLSATGSTDHSEHESFTTDHRTSESSLPLKDREITEGASSQPPTRFLFVRDVSYCPFAFQFQLFSCSKVGNVPNDVTGSALTDEFASECLFAVHQHNTAYLSSHPSSKPSVKSGEPLCVCKRVSAWFVPLSLAIM